MDTKDPFWSRMAHTWYRSGWHITITRNCAQTYRQIKGNFIQITPLPEVAGDKCLALEASIKSLIIAVHLTTCIIFVIDHKQELSIIKKTRLEAYQTFYNKYRKRNIVNTQTLWSYIFVNKLYHYLQNADYHQKITFILHWPTTKHQHDVLNTNTNFCLMFCRSGRRSTNNETILVQSVAVLASGWAQKSAGPKLNQFGINSLCLSY